MTCAANTELDDARKLDTEIRAARRRVNLEKATLAFLLLDMDDRRLFRELGFESLAAYARHAIAYDARTTRALVATARRARELPAIGTAFRAGEISWTAARTVLEVATPEDEGEWLERLRNCSIHALEHAVAAAKGEPPRRRIVLELGDEEYAGVEDVAHAVMRERPGISFDSAVAEACRRSLAGATRKGPVAKAVLYVCAECGKGTRETRDGTIAVSEARVEETLCDAKVVDLREGAKLSRSMPARVARRIDERDRNRCRVPDCGNRAFVERHHEGG